MPACSIMREGGGRKRFDSWQAAVRTDRNTRRGTVERLWSYTERADAQVGVGKMWFIRPNGHCCCMTEIWFSFAKPVSSWNHRTLTELKHRNKFGL